MFGLTFLAPLFLAALAAVAIPIALHLFRRKAELVIDFPAVRLLQRAPVEQQRRRRVRELFLLALRVTALALLAVAFARPYIEQSTVALPAPVTVIALDTSLSLSAPGQFAAAQQAARQAVEAAPATHSVALLTFADQSTLVVAPTTDRGAVLGAIGQVVPTAGGTRFRSALARSADAIGGDVGSIIMVTDLQQAGWEASDEGAVPDEVPVQVHAVPPPKGNLAVTSVRRDGDLVVAGVHNYGAQPERATVRLHVAERALVTETLALPAQAAAEVSLRASLPRTGTAEVQVDDATGYQGDNVRFLVLDPPAALPVDVVIAEPPESSNAGLYVERALALADDGRAFAPRTIEGSAFGRSQADATKASALFLLGTRSLDRASRDRIAAFLRDGGGVLVTLGPDVDVATLSDTLGTSVHVPEQPVQATGGATTLVPVDSRHPLFRPFVSPGAALGDIRVEQYRRLDNQQWDATLAQFSEGTPALVEQGVGRGRLLLFASDLDNRWNRFPLRAAFAPWVIESARYLTQGQSRRQTYTLPDVPTGAPVAAGIHAAPWGLVAVNPDIRESNPAVTTVEQFSASITRTGRTWQTRTQAAARVEEDRQRLWQIGLLVVLLVLATEGLIGRGAVSLYRRRQKTL